MTIGALIVRTGYNNTPDWTRVERVNATIYAPEIESISGQYAPFMGFFFAFDTDISGDTVRNDFAARMGANPFGDYWCGDTNLPPGVKWSGTYYVGSQVGNYTEIHESYACGHCAVVAQAKYSKPQDEVRAQVYGRMYHLPSTWQIKDHFPPRLTPELATDGFVTTMDTIRVAPEMNYGCGNCGRLGHNNRTCSLPAKAHHMVGIEIEGRWETNRFDDLRANDSMRGCSDGSVHYNLFRTDTRAWEFQTDPGTLRHALLQLISHYPDETGPDCGMHVHVSFPPTTVTMFATTTFYSYFRARWQAWGTRMGLHPNSAFFRRLVGANDYCRPNMVEFSNAWGFDDEPRYMQLNFQAWSEHKTVECRLLPMFRDLRIATSAVQELIAIFEDWVADPVLSLPAASLDISEHVNQMVSTDEHMEMDFLEDEIAEEEEMELDFEIPPPPPEGMRRVVLGVGTDQWRFLNQLAA